jgi:hypothetical protein
MSENEKWNFKTFSEYVNVQDLKVLKEGLIKTYPVSSLKKSLLSKKSELDIQKIQETLTFNNLPIGLSVFIGNSIFLSEIKKILDLFGYYIGLQRGSIIQVEPKYPFRIDKKNLPEFAYHITLKSRLNKILFKGLSPRNSETFFKHPSNRIYLLIAEKDSEILNLKTLLAYNKNLDSKELSVLKVHLGEPFYYIDTNLQIGTLSESCFGIFTTENISANFIKEM